MGNYLYLTIKYLFWREQAALGYTEQEIYLLCEDIYQTESQLKKTDSLKTWIWDNIWYYFKKLRHLFTSNVCFKWETRSGSFV